MSASDEEDEGGEGIIGRKLVFCPRLQTLEPDELIMTCPNCQCFFVFCCSCSTKYFDEGKPCHHFRLVFSDGACRLNGQVGATAGIGILYGEETESQRAIPVTSSLDPDQKRISQRAELLAAIAALRFMVEADRLNETKIERRRNTNHGPRDSEKAWVIAADSEYVVKGMTEWLRRWKNNGLRTNRGTMPANLDLFLKLDAEITIQEARQDVKIGFWHIPREYNTRADTLAKEASIQGDLE